MKSYYLLPWRFPEKPGQVHPAEAPPHSLDDDRTGPPGALRGRTAGGTQEVQEVQRAARW